MLPGGSCISDRAAFSEQDNYKRTRRSTTSDSCPLINIVREKQPGCINTAISIVDAAKCSLVKGICVSEHGRFAQALAYISFRMDGQCVNICDLASQIRVPIERLRKDVKRLSSRLGIVSASPVVANDIQEDVDNADINGDIAAFKTAVVGVLRPWNIASPAVMREINSWCTRAFQCAMSADDVDVINAPPKHSAEAALSIYCQQENNHLGVTNKRKRDGNSSDATMCFVESLTKHASARKAAKGIRKHLIGAETKRETT